MWQGVCARGWQQPGLRAAAAAQRRTALPLLARRQHARLALPVQIVDRLAGQQRHAA